MAVLYETMALMDEPSVNTVPSRQEMFEHAVRGLAGQGWQPALDMEVEGSVKCVYLTVEGRRCAWGWVDPEGSAGKGGDVESLHYKRAGVAGKLSRDDLRFATRLQRAHDDPFIAPSVEAGEMSSSMRASILYKSMREFGERERLTWPLDVAALEVKS